MFTTRNSQSLDNSAISIAKAWLLLVGGLAMVTIVLAACSSSDDGDRSKNAPDSGISITDGGPSGGGPDATPTDNGGTDPMPPNPNDCTQQPDFNSCANCFAMANQSGAQSYNQAIQDNCVCANECADTCVNQCADPNDMNGFNECNMCVNQAGQNQGSACIQGFSNDCRGNQDCASFAMSLQGCPQ